MYRSKFPIHFSCSYCAAVETVWRPGSDETQWIREESKPGTEFSLPESIPFSETNTFTYSEYSCPPFVCTIVRENMMWDLSTVVDSLSDLVLSVNIPPYLAPVGTFQDLMATASWTWIPYFWCNRFPVAMSCRLFFFVIYEKYRF